MTTLMQASQQWASRPADERFVSLLRDADQDARASRAKPTGRPQSTRKIRVLPDETDTKHRGLLDRDAMTGSLAGSADRSDALVVRPALQSRGAATSPASYFRESRLPAAIIADALNYNLRFTRDVDTVKLLSAPGDAAAVPSAHRTQLRPDLERRHRRHAVEQFGDGVTGYWRVPGEFGKTRHRRPGEHDAVRERSRHVRVPRRRGPSDRSCRAQPRPRLLRVEQRGG